MEKQRVSPAVHPVGARILVAPDLTLQPHAIQIEIMEWAPSGKYLGVRIQNSDRIEWHSVESFHIIEVLAKTPAPRKK